MRMPVGGGMNDPVVEWLGFAFDAPEGLDGAERESLVFRHTRFTDEDGVVGVVAALARAYPTAADEDGVRAFVRPQQLDDPLWSQVRHLLETAGPVRFQELRLMLRLLTSPDLRANAADAERLVGDWRAAVAG